MTVADNDRQSHLPLSPGTMSSILFAKHVSFEHSVSSPRPVITSRREKTTTTRPKFFSTQSSVSPLHAPSSARMCCLHVLLELGRGAASFLATESTGTVLIPRLMTRIADHVFTERDRVGTEDELLGAESNSVLPGALQDGADMRHVVRKSRVVNKTVVDNLGEIADLGEGGVRVRVELNAGRDESLRVSAKPVSAPRGDEGCEGLGVL